MASPRSAAGCALSPVSCPASGAREILIFNGTFPESVDSIPVDRVETLLLRGPSGTTEIDPARWTRGEVGSLLWRVRERVAGALGGLDERRTSRVELPFEENGTHLFALVQRPAQIAMTPGMFEEFLAEVGLEEEPIAAHGEENPHELFREWYVKTSTGIFQVGDEPTDGVVEPLDLVIELVPQKNPTAAKPGEGFPVQLRFEGRPLAGQPVLYGQRDTRERGRTDARGIFVLPVNDDGVWWVESCHVVPGEPESPIRHRSYWTTLTFEIP